MPLLPKPAECRSCALYGNGLGFSRSEGIGTLGVMMMAEALGEEEERDGLPLRPYAQSGSMWERIIKMAGYTRDQFILWNVVNCHPPKNWLDGAPWEASAISHCRVHRERVIDATRPRVIVALGGVACRTLTGESGEKRGISYLRGYLHKALRGYKTAPVPCSECKGNPGQNCFLCDSTGFDQQAVPDFSDIYVMPTFHPSFIQRGEKRMIPVVVHDIKRAVDLAQQLLHGRHPERKPVIYQTTPSLDEARSFELRCIDNQGALLVYDIETPSSASEDEDLREIGKDDDDDKPKKYPQDYALSNDETNIIQAQFSLAPFTGIAFPWQGEFVAIAKRILAMRHRKAGWNNSTFDDPRLKAAGCVINGTVEDFMWKWHHLQPDLPAGLQFACSFLGMDFPWKHLYNEQLDWYGCLTGESRIMCIGGPRKIEDIVRRREPTMVIGMDEFGNRVATRVVGWRKLTVPGQKWLRINVEAVDQPLYLTPDHEVWSNGKWVKAVDLRPGDEIISSGCGDSELLHGTLLGDASCDKRGRFKFTHCDDQYEWFSDKRRAVNGPVHKPITVHPRVIKKGYPAVGKGIHHRTEIWVSPTLWRKRFYSDAGKLFVPPSDKALAVWYCDDGCWAVSAEAKERGYMGNPRIILQGFANLPVAIAWFKERFGEDNVSFYRDKRFKQGGAVALVGEGRRLFFDAVSHYIPSSMERKLPAQYRGRYCGWLNSPKPQKTIVTSIESYDPGKRQRNHRYCITVDHPTHRFFAMGGLVKNCADVDAPQRADQALTDSLRKMGIERGYQQHIVALTPILQDAADRGVPINREKLAVFEEKIAIAQEDVRVTKIMPKVEGLGLGKIEPKEGLKTANSLELKKLLATMSEAEAPQVRLSHIDAKGKESFYRFERRPFFDKKSAQIDIYQVGLPLGDTEPTPNDTVMRWCRHFEFNPGSADQLKSYMKAKKHPVPKDFKTDAETTNKQELIRLAAKTKDNFYLDVISFREFQKMRSTYCIGWAPKADGCVHTTWTFRPATGQLSSVDPCIQNAPKHAELAKEFRDCVEAPTGFKLVEFDYKSFHALTLGFEAQDADYMRLARLDIHSYVAAHLLKIPERDKLITMADDELADRLAFVKKNHKFVRDKKAKPTILGYGFGLGYRKLYQMNRESFTGEKDAKTLIDLLDHLFPKTCAFREAVKHRAQRDYRLVSRHGYHRRFYDVLVYWGMGRIEDAVRRGRKVPSQCLICKQRHENGEEAEQAIAFLPANDAFGTIKDAMLELEVMGWHKRALLCNQIHDSLMFMMPDELMDEAIPAIHAVMVKPSIILTDPVVAPNGLVCDVEVGVGQTWRKLETVSVATGMAA